MWRDILFLLCLPFAFLHARDILGTLPKIESEKSPITETCFRWDPTGERALSWTSNGAIDAGSILNSMLNSSGHSLKFLMKSAAQFFGGLTERSLMDGVGEGGFLGITMAISGKTSCKYLVPSTLAVIQSNNGSRIFASLPIGRDEQRHKMVQGAPTMHAYGLTSGATDLSPFKYIAVRYLIENLDREIPPIKEYSKDLAFRTKDNNTFRVLDCGESVDNVAAFKLHMSHISPTEIDLSKIFANFGDTKISESEIKLACGVNTSAGCPGTRIDQKVLGNQPGFQDTVLPTKLFETTNSEDVQINIKRVTENQYFMDFVLPIQGGYATLSNPTAKNRYFVIEFPFDRTGIKNQCDSQPLDFPAIPTRPGMCLNTSDKTPGAFVGTGTPKSPPIRAPCFRTGYTLCSQDDINPDEVTRVYLGYCSDDRRCRRNIKFKHTSPPFTGYISFKPLGAALARTSSSLVQYDKLDAACIATIEAPTEATEDFTVITAEAVAGAVGVVIVTGSIIGIFVALSTGTAAGAAVTASVLLLKYGLQFRRQTMKLETDTDVMKSKEKIPVKQAPSLPLRECINYLIALTYDRDNIDEKERQSIFNLSSPHIAKGSPARASLRKAKSMRSMRRSFSRKLSRFSPQRMMAYFAKPLSMMDIRILRFKMERSLKWAADPERPFLADGMTVDEAAAIMLYTQECCLYRHLNAALRHHNVAELAPYLPFMKLLLSALYKLPLVHATVYRGVKLDLGEVYNTLAGDHFTWWSFSSTTLNLSVLESPLFLGKEGKRTLFCIQAVGVDIAAFSAMPHESEVLMLPGMRLRIEPGTAEEEMWTFNMSVLMPKYKDLTKNEDTEPLIDFPHPGIEEEIPDALEPMLYDVEMTRISFAWPSIPGLHREEREEEEVPPNPQQVVPLSTV